MQVLEFGVIGETYNVGGRQERTNREVVEAICDLLDDLQPANKPHRRLITFVRDRPGHDRRYAIDPSKIESRLGWRAMETFGSGLEKTVRWFWENQPWWQAILDRGYNPTRIGLLAARR
jgi:dTDP-glucose 4,6-dehydratase